MSHGTGVARHQNWSGVMKRTLSDRNARYIAYVLGCRPIRDEEPEINPPTPAALPKKRLVMAVLLGGALFGAPLVLLDSASSRPERVAVSPSVQSNSASHGNNGMALALDLAPASPPPPTGANSSTVTVNPGMTIRDIAKEVGTLPGHSESSFLQAAGSGAVHSFYVPLGSTKLEGVLGTGTYTVEPGESDTTILYDMVLQFNHEAKEAGLTFASASRRGYSVNQILTVASIIQEEGYIAKNMPDVARVIYNRLAQEKPLQMNATILYPLGEDGGAFTTQDLHVVSPYNTYLNTGLPPTPICTPSLTAMQAAMDPPSGNWLYFNVVSSNGTEAFSSTFSAQLANEKLAQKLGLG